MHDVAKQNFARVKASNDEYAFRILVENNLGPTVRDHCEDRNSHTVRVTFSSIDSFIQLLRIESSGDYCLGRELNGFQKAFNYVLERGITHETELLSLSTEGEKRRDYFRLLPEFDASGNIVSIRVVTKNSDIVKKLGQYFHELEFQREVAREEERKRIARDLHDGLGQLLTTIRMETSNLKLKYKSLDRNCQNKLQDIIALMDKTIHETRHLAFSLRPPALDNGIVYALTSHINEFSERSSIPCELSIDEDLRLFEAQAVAIYRIVQECLTNILRHANAKKVRVSLISELNGFRLKICDDGKGVGPASYNSSSLGLLGIRERTCMLGGKFAISSMPGSGTEINVFLPFDPEGHAT